MSVYLAIALITIAFVAGGVVDHLYFSKILQRLEEALDIAESTAQNLVDKLKQ